MARKKRKTKPKQTAEAIASTPQQVFPKLGHQLIISHPKPIQGLKQSEGWMRIAPTWSQRLRRFFTTFSEAFIFSLFAVIALYLPDFVADYAHRGEHFLHFFFVFILSAVVIIGLCAAILTFIRDTVCYIHPQNARIIYGSRFNKAKIDGSLPISEIPILEIIPPSPILKRSRILTIYQDMEIHIAETYGDDKDINDLYDWLKSFRS